MSDAGRVSAAGWTTAVDHDSEAGSDTGSDTGSDAGSEAGSAAEDGQPMSAGRNRNAGPAWKGGREVGWENGGRASEDCRSGNAGRGCDVCLLRNAGVVNDACRIIDIARIIAPGRPGVGAAVCRGVGAGTASTMPRTTTTAL
jgi:hypothetical protein